MPNTIYWSKITQSTNLDAMNARDRESDRTVWCAEFQTAGRGQRGNKWESSTGENLTFSILFKPTDIPAAEQFVISQVVSVGIVNYLQSHGLDAKIKWPNDIYIGDRKICGMLIENILRGDNLAVAVCGIGLNINQCDFPEELPNPTSLIIEYGRLSLLNQPCRTPFDIPKELSAVLAHIFDLYEKIGETSVIESIENEYCSRLYRLEELHDFEETEYYTGTDRIGLIKGRITGIEKETARLQIALEDGQVRKYFFKEIRYII